VQQADAARAARLPHRVDPVCADMRAAPFPPAVFDLVWSEGALYSIGFRRGLALCARLVRPGGVIAVSEAVWTAPEPPREVADWWTAACADIAAIDEKTGAVRDAGFDILGHFTLPREAWWDHLYGPIRARLEGLRQTWADDDAGLSVIAEFDAEIEMFERWGHTCGYEFFVARRPDR
jgi:SAM-dependent methyltransferase